MNLEGNVLQLPHHAVDPRNQRLLHQRRRQTARRLGKLPNLQPAQGQHRPATNIKAGIEADRESFAKLRQTQRIRAWTEAAT
jgi:hypothetical protein